MSIPIAGWQPERKRSAGIAENVRTRAAIDRPDYCATTAVVVELVKSKRINADGTLDGENFHWRAASSASLAKNWLGAAESRSAEATEPSGFTLTRTLMRTVPRIVERALSETLGITWCTTEADPAAGADSERGGLLAERTGAGGFLAAADGTTVEAAGLAADAGGSVAGEVVVFFSGAREEAVAGGGCEDGRVVSPEVAGARGVSRRKRGTINAATTSVPAAPMTKYFNEPRDTRGSAGRRGAAIVTFT